MNLIKKIQLTVLIATLLCASGCLRRNIGSLDQVIATADDRAGSLEPAVQNFHKAIYWQAYADVGALVDPSVKGKLLPQLETDRGGINYVDWKVKDIAFKNDNSSADVTVSVRYYKIPRYIVDTRLEHERWEYRRTEGGWLCASHSVE